MKRTPSKSPDQKSPFQISNNIYSRIKEQARIDQENAHFLKLLK